MLGAKSLLSADKVRIEQALLHIVDASENYRTPREPRDMSKAELKWYANNSRKRLQALVECLPGGGWEREYASFRVFDGRADGTNAYFWKGKRETKRVWVTAHSDHCAGKGANDNASGMACIAELQRLMQHSEGDESAGFAVFDFEEGGLLGSKIAAADSTSPIKKDRTAFVLNIDGIGQGPDIVLANCGDLDANLVLQDKYNRRIIEAFARRGRSLQNVQFYDGGADHTSFMQKGMWAATVATIDVAAYGRYRAMVRKNKGKDADLLRSESEDWKKTTVNNTPDDCMEHCKPEQIAAVTTCVHEAVMELIRTYC